MAKRYNQFTAIPAKERFLEKVDVKSNSECWEWKASKQSDGYGQFGFNGKVQLAHRVAWILFHGDIPDNQFVLHTCDNRGCVNYINHLFLGTNSDNMLDMFKKGRDPHNGGKLTKEQALAIRILFQCQISTNELANLYSVSKRAIRDIIKKRTYKYL